ncbi:hypothetical protein ACWX0P_29620 [Vibrio mediterranei]
MSSDINLKERLDAIEIGVSIALSTVIDQLAASGLSPEATAKAIDKQLETQRQVQSDYPEYQDLYSSHNHFLEQMLLRCQELAQDKEPLPENDPPKGRPSWFRGLYTGKK